jgi:hypothetical protein
LKRYALVVGMGAVHSAMAQQPPPPPLPEVEALQQRVLLLTGEVVSWQTQAIALRRQVDDLNKQLVEAKKHQP